jgi:hypothetical protein
MCCLDKGGHWMQLPCAAGFSGMLLQQIASIVTDVKFSV